MPSTHQSWIKPPSILSPRAEVIPKSSHWKKRAREVGNTSNGSPRSPKRSSSISRPNAGLQSRRYSLKPLYSSATQYAIGRPARSLRRHGAGQEEEGKHDQLVSL